MAKKTQISENTQQQFNKLQFQPGDYVFFTWLGMKKYGYVKTTKQTNWGTQYMVESHNTRYPCGIQIKGEKTAYTTGCIYYEETLSIGQQELKRRAETTTNNGYTKPPTVATPGSNRKNENRIENGGTIPTSIVDKPKSKKQNASRKHANEPSDKGMRGINSKKRSATKLDDAIQRQRDFLSGFIKPD